jgi:hypothetical protein
MRYKRIAKRLAKESLPLNKSYEEKQFPTVEECAGHLLRLGLRLGLFDCETAVIVSTDLLKFKRDDDTY